MSRLMRRLAGTSILMLLSCAALAAADVGLINQLQGEVSFQGGSAVSRATAFMKVRDGDRFTLADGAVVRVVYFEGGRQETWRGPAAFKAGQKQGDALTGKAEISQLPAGVSSKLAQTAEVIQIARLGRAGGVTVRGVKAQPQLSASQQAEVAQARKMYDTLRANAANDDITPELYLYTVLESNMLYDDMKVVIKSMQDRQPNSQEVRELAAWASGR